MSGFEIFGAISAAWPILDSTIPTIKRVIKTLRDSKAIKAELAYDIGILCDELRAWYEIYTKMLKNNQGDLQQEYQITTAFGPLFEDFPIIVARMSQEAELVARQSALGLLMNRSNFREKVLELEKQLQHISRRIILLAMSISNTPSFACQATGTSAQVDRDKRIQNILLAQRDAKLESDVFIQDNLVGETGRHVKYGMDFRVAKLERLGLYVRIFATMEPSSVTNIS
ncbi:hypothetical protein RhiJN_26386 [Ceratobasidium sp. AG-Ba]|nr:hypothetical protein RhiJN_26386 [Ceratobasidium sp. AG-Ba]